MATTNEVNSILDAFHLRSDLDRSNHDEVSKELRSVDDGSTIPCSVTAAVLISIIKGLALPAAYLNPHSILELELSAVPPTTPSNASLPGLRGLAINFVRFQSQNRGAGPALTLVQIAQHCSRLLKKSEETSTPSQLLELLFQNFMKYISIDEEVNRIGDGVTNNDQSPVNLNPFQKLLIFTVDSLCSNTQYCLEDLMDFEYLWDSFLTFSDKSLSVLLYEAGASANVSAEPLEATDRAKRPSDFTSSRQKKYSRIEFYNTIKESAWVLSRTVYVSRSVANGSQQVRRDRKDQIVTVAACIDLVVAAILTPSMDPKQGEPNNNKRPRIEGQTSTTNDGSNVVKKKASTESRMINELFDLKRKEMSNTRGEEASTHLSKSSPNYYGKLKGSITKSANNLISSVSRLSGPIFFHDIQNSSQSILTQAVDWLSENSFPNQVAENVSDDAAGRKKLLLHFSSHEMRRTTLLWLRKIYHNKLKNRTQESLNNFQSCAAKSPRHESALKIGWFVGKLQQYVFIDSVNEFFSLTVPERVILASFDSKSTTSQTESQQKSSIATNSQQRCGKGYSNGTHQQSGNSDGKAKVEPVKELSNVPNSLHSHQSKPRHRSSIYVCGLKNPPTTNIEITELQKWTHDILSIASPFTNIKPSPRLVIHLDSSGKKWKSVVLPVLNYFLAVVAEDCMLGIGADDVSSLYSVNSAGVHVVPRNAIQPKDLMPSSVLRLYYFSLECILVSETARRKSATNPTLVLNEKFHSSLFALCYFCLHKATSLGNQYSFVEETGDCPVVYYRIIESFIQAMEPSSDAIAISSHQSMALPVFVIKLLRQLQEIILGLVWMTNCSVGGSVQSNFVEMINSLREIPGLWPLANLRRSCPIKCENRGKHPDSYSSLEIRRAHMLVEYMLWKLLSYLKNRITTMCNLLKKSIRNSHIVVDKAMSILVAIICHRIEMLYDHHPDQIMMCIMYAICAKMNAASEINFCRIKDAYKEMNKNYMGSEIVHKITHRIKISSENDRYGNIVNLYNDVFVPGIKCFWKSLSNYNGPSVQIRPEIDSIQFANSLRQVFELNPTTYKNMHHSNVRMFSPHRGKASQFKAKVNGMQNMSIAGSFTVGGANLDQLVSINTILGRSFVNDEMKI